MLVKDLKNIFHTELDAIYGKEEVQTFFFMLTEAYNTIKRLDLALNVDLTIGQEDVSKYKLALQALKNHQPIQYILGKTEFYGLPFNVNQNTLIPRPETEELVNWIITCHAEHVQATPLTILDIGTGTGCIAISLAKNIEKAKVFALDVSDEAIETAKQNAYLNEVEVEFVQTNILNKDSSDLELINFKFDVIVSNPPYVRHQEKLAMQDNVLNYEPHLALFVEDENPLIFYTAITELATKKLKPNGELYFEINEYLGQEMIALLKEYGFEDVQLKQDLFGKNRMVKGIFK